MTAPTPLPDVTTLHELLRYENGLLFWRRRAHHHFPSERSWKTWNTCFADEEAFTYVSAQGYREGALFGRSVKAHRLIFKMHHSWAPAVIDHIDRNRLNNRIENLRASSKSENAMNGKTPADNTSGVRGVARHRDRWRAYLKGVHLGTFPTIEEAAEARLKAEVSSHWAYSKTVKELNL